MSMRRRWPAAALGLLAAACGSRASEPDERLEREGLTGNCGLSRATVTVLKRLEGNLVAWALEDTELLPLHACRGAAPPG